MLSICILQKVFILTNAVALEKDQSEKKSKKFIIKDGVLFFKKKKKNKVGKGVLL